MYSVPMALVDFIPVVCFLIGAITLQRGLYNKMSKGAFALFAAGTIDVFMAGFLKALYKLLYAAGVCDFEKLSQMFFPVQAIGFVLAGAGLLAMICHKQGEGKTFGFVPAFSVLFAAAAANPGIAPEAYSGTMLFVVLMVLGLAVMDVVLCIVSAKLKKPGLIAFFVIACVFSLAMGYLSSKDFTESYMNWVAEAINVIGQGSFMLGALKLKKAGLQELSL